jgi:uncharacterized membrane protein YidH (DUF202 family)
LASEVSAGGGTVVTWGRRALALVVAGLVLQILATFYWSPATFLMSAALGLPFVLLGAAIFGWAVLRARSRDARARDGGG